MKRFDYSLYRYADKVLADPLTDCSTEAVKEFVKNSPPEIPVESSAALMYLLTLSGMKKNDNCRDTTEYILDFFSEYELDDLCCLDPRDGFILKSLLESCVTENDLPGKHYISMWFSVRRSHASYVADPLYILMMTQRYCLIEHYAEQARQNGMSPALNGYFEYACGQEQSEFASMLISEGFIPSDDSAAYILSDKELTYTFIDIIRRQTERPWEWIMSRINFTDCAKLICEKKGKERLEKLCGRLSQFSVISDMTAARLKTDEISQIIKDMYSGCKKLTVSVHNRNFALLEKSLSDISSGAPIVYDLSAVSETDIFSHMQERKLCSFIDRNVIDFGDYKLCTALKRLIDHDSIDITERLAELGIINSLNVMDILNYMKENMKFNGMCKIYEIINGQPMT